MTQVPASSHGGGAASPLERAAVKLAADTAMLGTGDTIPFDTIYYDASNYFDAANFRFLVPVGKDGLFLFGCELQVTADVTLTGASVSLDNSGAYPNGSVPVVRDSLLYKGNGCLAVPLAAGDEVHCRFYSNLGATVKGGFSTTFWIVRLSA